jgi:hypothetical protein
VLPSGNTGNHLPTWVHRVLWPEFQPAAEADVLRTPLTIQLIDPDAQAQLLNNQARVLATHAEPKTCDPGRAVKLAQEAVELAPKHPSYWNTLGVAHYRSREFSFWKREERVVEESSASEVGVAMRSRASLATARLWATDGAETGQKY